MSLALFITMFYPWILISLPFFSSIQSYEAAFEQIKEATDIEDLQLLVGKFIETEDKNFALFNYVNELNNEIELLQEHIGDIQMDMDKFKQEAVDMDEQREIILEKLKVLFLISTNSIIEGSCLREFKKLRIFQVRMKEDR